MDETKELLKAIEGRLVEAGAALDGLTHAMARLEGRVEKVEQGMVRLEGRVETVERELVAFRQDVNRRFDSVDEKLTYFGEKWLEHDQVLYRLQRKQA